MEFSEFLNVKVTLVFRTLKIDKVDQRISASETQFFLQIKTGSCQYCTHNATPL